MAIEAVPYIDPAPVPGPQRSDESTFDDRMDAKIRWDETSAQQFGDLADNVVHNATEALNSATAAAGQAAAASGYATAAAASASAANSSASAAGASAVAADASAVVAANAAAAVTASSSSSVTLGSGNKVFTVPAGKQFFSGIPLAAVSVSTPSARMFGTVGSYVGTSLTITVVQVEGPAGTYNDWVISPSGARGPTGGTAGGQLTGAIDELKGADLPSASTIDPWVTGGNLMTLTGNVVINAIANAPQAGAKRTLLVSGTPTITSSANVVVKGGTISLLPGDEVDIEAETTTKFRVTVRRGDGTPTAPVTFSNIEVLTTSQTWTAKYTGMHRITMVGASASGGAAVSGVTTVASAAASGGGTGGVVRKTFYATAGDTFLLNLGSRGATVTATSAAGPNQAVNGNDAGDSTFIGGNVSLTAGGGKKGSGVLSTTAASAVAVGGLGGSASGGDFNYPGAQAGTATATNGTGLGLTIAATGGAASPYKGLGYGSGNATTTAGSAQAASGGAGVGGKSGNAQSASGVAQTAGGSYVGASTDAPNSATTSTPGPALSSLATFVIAPIKLGAAGTAASNGSTGASTEGAGTGAVYGTAGSNTSGVAALMGGTGGAVVAGAASPATATSGQATYGGASGGAAAYSTGNAITATSGNGGDAFAIIESK